MPVLAPAETAVAAADLVKVYGSADTAVRALNGVTVTFAAGEFTAIMGPSGSGKSTLMHCLAGLDSVTSGSVRIGGTELSGLGDKALTRLRRSRVGFVFQSFNLLPTLTAEQNIRLPLELAGRQPDPRWWDTVITATGIGARLRHRPAELSGGQQQRVACARALITRPDVVDRVHRSFFEVGCDVVETDTFGAFGPVLAEYGQADRVHELNLAAATLARQAADDFSTPDRPRWVAGSIGPGTKFPTLGQIPYLVLRDAYQEQATALLAGGVDLQRPPGIAAEFAALFPAARLVVQPEAGHYPWLDDAGWFVAAVTAFLDQEP